MSTEAASDSGGVYPWVRVGCSLALMTIGAVGLYGSIVTLKPIAAEFGVSRSAASAAYAVTNIGFGVGGVFMGRWSDRIGVMWPCLLGAFAVATGMLLASRAGSLGQFVLFHGLVIGLLGNSAVLVPLVADITRWFERHRGVAVAIVISGIYLAGVIWPPLIQHGVDTVGWRLTYYYLGVFAFASMVPLAFVLYRRAPPVVAATATAAGDDRPLGLSPLAVQCLLCTAGVGCCVAMATPQAHIIAHATDLGYPAARGAEMLAVLLGGGIVSRLAYGWISDRIGGLRTLVVGSAMQAAALAMFIPVTGLGPLYAMAAIFGLSQGGIVPAYALIIRRYFSPAEVGRRLGAVILFTMIGMALGAWLAGLLFDLTGSYRAAFANAVGFNLLNLGVAFGLLTRARFAYRA